MVRWRFWIVTGIAWILVGFAYIVRERIAGMAPQQALAESPLDSFRRDIKSCDATLTDADIDEMVAHLASMRDTGWSREHMHKQIVELCESNEKPATAEQRAICRSSFELLVTHLYGPRTESNIHETGLWVQPKSPGAAR